MRKRTWRSSFKNFFKNKTKRFKKLKPMKGLSSIPRRFRGRRIS